jgi:hypothetical protein
VAELENSRRRFEQQRTQQEEVVAADECDVYARQMASGFLEVTRGGESADSAAEYYNLRPSVSGTRLSVSGHPQKVLLSREFR